MDNAYDEYKTVKKDEYKIEVEIINDEHRVITASACSDDLTELKNYMKYLILWECNQFKWCDTVSLSLTTYLNGEYFDHDEALVIVNEDYSDFEVIEG